MDDLFVRSAAAQSSSAVRKIRANNGDFTLVASRVMYKES